METDVAKVREGMQVQVHLDCCPNEVFPGKVARIFPYLDAQTRTNTVEVILDNPRDVKKGSRRLKPGMFGRAEITVEKREGVLAAPEPALLLDSQILAQQKANEILRKAFVVENGKLARRRLVKLGARKGSLYEVLEGLAEGEKIVVRGQHGLKEGQKVEIVTDEAGQKQAVEKGN